MLSRFLPSSRTIIRSCLRNKGAFSSVFIHSRQTQNQFIEYKYYYSTQSPKKVALLLSGCGYLDGNEIGEVVSLLTHLTGKGHTLGFFSPTIEIDESIVHSTRKVDPKEERYVHKEATRITRQPVNDVANLKAQDYDILIIPGGFGNLKNLCNYDPYPDEFEVHPEVERVVKEFNSLKKPIALCGTAGVVVGRILGKKAGGPGIKVTTGNEPKYAGLVTEWGNEHIESNKVSELELDLENKIVSTPAHMVTQNPYDVHLTMEKLIEEAEELAQ